MRFAERFALRVVLNRLKRSRSDNEERLAVEALLKDREALEQFAESARSEFARQNSGNQANGDFIKWLLEWLLENADEIIKIILAVVPLFADQAE